MTRNRNTTQSNADLIEEYIRRAGSIGALERLAGIGTDPQSRAAFWLDYAHLPASAGLDAGCEALKQRFRACATGTRQ